MNFLERVVLRSQFKIGDYVISGNIILGKGEFGTVVKGHRINDPNEVVAIKTIKIQDKSVEREINILESLKSLECPQILKLVYSTNDLKNYYLVTEYCNGGTLKDLFKAKTKLSDAETKVFIGQIASAMKFLDCKEIAHRDLKPDNILIHYAIPNSINFKNIVFKLADFGLAIKIKKGEKCYSKCGSWFYMAPEVVAGHQEGYDRKVDLWSIGVVMYQGMVGALPINVNKVCEIKKLMASPISIVLPTSLSPDARNLINGLLAYCAAQRIEFQQFFGHPFVVNDRSCTTSQSKTGSASPQNSTSNEIHLRISEPIGQVQVNANTKDCILLRDVLVSSTSRESYSKDGSNSFIMVEHENNDDESLKRIAVPSNDSNTCFIS